MYKNKENTCPRLKLKFNKFLPNHIPMQGMRDLTNQQFGKLTVLHKSHTDKWKSSWWLCKCECGNEILVRSCRLTGGITKSCGCLQTGKPVENLVGQTFNRLTVLEYSGKDRFYGSKWKCSCICGNITIVSRTHLIGDKVKSCGCYKQEIDNSRIGNRNPNYNIALTEQDRVDRRTIPGVKEWSKQVKENYKFACDKCGSSEPKQLVSHHLFNYKDYPELRFDVNNGVCLCPTCHRQFHFRYGYRHTTKQQNNKTTKQQNNNI